MKETIKLKPIDIFFCNINKEMNLTGHCHYATLEIEFETIGNIGYPSFLDTFNEIESFILSKKLKGFKGTNEDLLRYLHNEVKIKTPDFEFRNRYKGDFKLFRTVLNVMGVKDENNHASGFTTYAITE